MNSELRHRAAMTDAVLHKYTDLRRKHEVLRVHAAKLEEDNRQLRKRLREASAKYRRLKQAYDDVLLMMAYAAVNLHPSRRLMTGDGLMSIRRWDRARALAQVARVHDGKNFTADEETAVAALAAAVERCAEDDFPVRLRLPKR